jgi:hypothetical protein
MSFYLKSDVGITEDGGCKQYELSLLVPGSFSLSFV